MEKVKGYIEKIIFHNKENGYTILTLEAEEGEVICVGNFQLVNEGEYIEVEGEVVVHPTYGEQLKMLSYQVKQPEDKKGIIKYLGSGAIKGIGPKLAERIVKKFGDETFIVMENEPERLAEVKGISRSAAQKIADQLENGRDVREAMLYLQKYGIAGATAVKIYNKYKQRTISIVENNPYKLAEDIKGIGFKIADEIAVKVGISPDSPERVKCAILYLLLQGANEGNVFLVKDDLVRRAVNTLSCDIAAVEKGIEDLFIEKKIKLDQDGDHVYHFTYYYTELAIARALDEINVCGKYKPEYVNRIIEIIEGKSKIQLDNLQKKAVFEAANNGILVITGGPGTGKTTTINSIIKYFEYEGLEVLLAAPTGRAAKRMSESTGKEAKTIHRMLELNGELDDSREGARFERNEENPLEADVIIIDEMSMVDIFLMKALLNAITPGTRLILVGDVDQLPSVGPGNVLKDIIDANIYKVVKLTKIFRQAEESEIVVNAHKINKGEHVELRTDSKDFIFLERLDQLHLKKAVHVLITQKLPKYVNASTLDIQILTPMKKGKLGVETLNADMQMALNPPTKNKAEVDRNGIVFREGDKVMHIKNNYQLEWELRGKKGQYYESGQGVFNGETGIITRINKYAEMVEVEYDEGKFVTYTYKQLEELELAYAVTVHKSQGSEYPAVVIPLLEGPSMLMNRNILYTAVTRAKSCVCIVGSRDKFYQMVDNISKAKRYSGLKKRIMEISEGKE